MSNDFIPPTQAEIVAVLREHPLVRLNERVRRAFLVGSFAKGQQRARGSIEGESDVDILLEVVPRQGYSASDLEEEYRRDLRQFFVDNDIRGKADEVHPQWDGRRVDLYFTYDADSEPQPKILLSDSNVSRIAPRQAAKKRQRRSAIEETFEEAFDVMTQDPGFIELAEDDDNQWSLVRRNMREYVEGGDGNERIDELAGPGTLQQMITRAPEFL